MVSETTLQRVLLVVVAALLLVPLLSMAFVMPMMGMWGWGHMDGSTWGGMGGGWMLLPWLVVVVLLVGGAVALSRLASDAEEGDAALEELRLAYARGDLTDEEYEERRERLEREG